MRSYTVYTESRIIAEVHSEDSVLAVQRLYKESLRVVILDVTIHPVTKMKVITYNTGLIVYDDPRWYEINPICLVDPKHF